MNADLVRHRRLTRQIISAFDSPIVRAYGRARFTIINATILDMLSRSLQGKHRILEIGCGFGLFGSYLAARDPEVRYHGIDLNAKRIELARSAAARLGLSNTRFDHGDARGDLQLDPEYDAVLMMDLLHHVPDPAKHRLIETATSRLAPGGHLVMKDIGRRPWPKLFFTWALDVAMTGGFDMWYWDEQRFRDAVPSDWRLEAYPISDWLPYPHVLYLASRAPVPLVEPAGR
ncbi:MAG: class I SAM-dependent methyltransferase [Gemmatimonadales bacterium]|nr:class I SAM-dependent methyltransferase [Gemmatimonadales bacterium]